MPNFDNFPPCGVDRADGSGPDFPGTPTPDGAVLQLPIVTGDYFLEEMPDSPEMETSEQGTFVHTFKCDEQTHGFFLQTYYRGRFVTDSFENVFRILDVRHQHQKGDYWVVRFTMESISFNSPPDEFELNIIELNPTLDKHPRYGFLTAQQRRLVQSAVNAATNEEQNTFGVHVVGPAMKASATQRNLGITDLEVQTAANELATKLFIGEETFYLPGFEIIWSRYFWKIPLLHPGGIIEDPVGIVPYFFLNPLGANTTTETIFDDYILFNPQFYTNPFGSESGGGISWLRKADRVQYSRTWFRVTHTWHGAPYAHWDADLYSPFFSPYPPPLNPILPK